MSTHNHRPHTACIGVLCRHTTVTIEIHEITFVLSEWHLLHALLTLLRKCSIERRCRDVWMTLDHSTVYVESAIISVFRGKNRGNYASYVITGSGFGT